MRLGREVLRCAVERGCPFRVSVREDDAWTQREEHEREHRELVAMRALVKIRRAA